MQKRRNDRIVEEALKVMSEYYKDIRIKYVEDDKVFTSLEVGGMNCRTVGEESYVVWFVSSGFINGIIDNKRTMETYLIENKVGIIPEETVVDTLVHLILHELAHLNYYLSYSIIPENIQTLRHDFKWAKQFKNLYDTHAKELRKNLLDILD